jgi:hypothetical protein
VSYEPKHLERWTMPKDYFGSSWPEYYRAGFGRHRDSDCLAESNFRVALKALGGESETVLVIRESHWAVGWIEWIAIHESDSKSLQIADGLIEDLESYPVLNEDDWSELEQETADETWRQCFTPSDRVEYIRKFRDQFEFRDFRDMLGCVRGQYFAGYASELLS